MSEIERILAGFSDSQARLAKHQANRDQSVEFVNDLKELCPYCFGSGRWGPYATGEIKIPCFYCEGKGIRP
jgi:hypothetical protein